jgi:hypothetical protein
MSGMERIRRLLFGGSADRRARVSSALSSAARLQVGGLFPETGPFDEPPSEPIALAPDLPWELQDDGDSASGPKRTAQREDSSTS